MKSATKRSIVFLGGLAIVCLMSVGAFAAIDSTAGNAGFQYLDIPPSPRQIGMGWTGTALGANGLAYYNPASPFVDRSTFLSIGYAPMPFDQSIAHAQGSYVAGDFFVGANITNLVVNGIYPSNFDLEPDYNTPFSYNGSLLSVNAGYRAGRFGVGVTLNGLQEQIGPAAAYGISASVGLVYKVNNNLTAGAAALQLGSSTGFTDDTKKLGHGYALPRSGRAGVAFCDTAAGVPYTVSGDVVYRDVGLRGTPVASRFTRLSVPLGIEVRPTSYVAVRLGKRLNYDTELLTCGAGLSWSVISFDLAFAFKNYAGSFEADPFFSLTYTLGAQSGNVPKIKAPVPQPSSLEKPAVPAPLPQKAAAAEGHADTAQPAAAPGTEAIQSDSIPAVPKKAENVPVDNSGEHSGPQPDSALVKQPLVPVKP
jgi:hypothetical protein